MYFYDSLFSQLWPKGNDFENNARQEPKQLFSAVRTAGLGPLWAATAFIRPNSARWLKASLNFLQKLSIQVLLEDTSENPLGSLMYVADSALRNSMSKLKDLYETKS